MQFLHNQAHGFSMRYVVLTSGLVGRDVVRGMSVDSAQFGAFLAALVALVASPGPATLALAGAGAAFGFRAARLFFTGMLCGAALTISLVGSGVVGALIAHPIVAHIFVGLATLYMVYLAYRIATAPPLGGKAATGRIPGFLPGFILAIANPKAYAVFATLFSGFTIIPGDIARDAVLKGCVTMTLLTVIDLAWLYAGSALRHLFQDPKVSRLINISFAVLLLVSVALAVRV